MDIQLGFNHSIMAGTQISEVDVDAELESVNVGS
jgi:hypothetical protein